MNRPRSLWEIAVLALLREETMHPYEMQRLLQLRHKDELLALKRGSLYHAVNRLMREGLIEPVSTAREGRRPERTTYRITPAGEDDLLRSLRRMVAVPHREPSEFFAGLSFLVYLTPRDASAQLRDRATRLHAEIDNLTTARERLISRVMRINIIEEEYLLAMRRAELIWVRSLIDDVESRRLTWNLGEILKAARAARRREIASKRSAS